MERVKLRSGTVGTDAMCNCTWTLASRSFEKTAVTVCLRIYTLSTLEKTSVILFTDLLVSPSPSIGGLFFAELTSWRRAQETRCTCPYSYRGVHAVHARAPRSLVVVVSRSLPYITRQRTAPSIAKICCIRVYNLGGFVIRDRSLSCTMYIWHEQAGSMQPYVTIQRTPP
jgi:hypothetical protein